MKIFLMRLNLKHMVNNYNGDDDNYDEEEEEDEYSDEELTTIDEIKDFHKYILKKDFNL